MLRVEDTDQERSTEAARQAILDSWPARVDDRCARAEWGWNHEYDLDAMSDDLVPKIRAMLGK